MRKPHNNRLVAFAALTRTRRPTAAATAQPLRWTSRTPLVQAVVCVAILVSTIDAIAMSALTAERAIHGLTYAGQPAPRVDENAWYPMIITAPLANLERQSLLCDQSTFDLQVGRNGRVDDLRRRSEETPNSLDRALSEAATKWLFYDSKSFDRRDQLTIRLQTSVDCETGELEMAFSDDVQQAP